MKWPSRRPHRVGTIGRGVHDEVSAVQRRPPWYLEVPSRTVDDWFTRAQPSHLEVRSLGPCRLHGRWDVLQESMIIMSAAEGERAGSPDRGPQSVN